MRKIQTLLSLTLIVLVLLSAISCDDEKDETPIQPTIETTIQPSPIEQSSIEPTIDSSIPPTFAGLVSVSLQDDIYHLSWEPAVDDQTDQDSIMYEIFEAENAGVGNYDFLSPLTSIEGSTSIDIPDLDTASRHYFIVRAQDDEENTDQNTIEQTQRDLGLSGAPNFRDLGGYINADGIQIEWGQIYRSGDLATLSDADLPIVNNIGLNTILDIREQDDIDRDGYDVIYTGNEAIYDFLFFNSGDPALLVELPDHPLKKLAVDVRLVKQVRDLSSYQTVVIGSAIYSGKWLPEAVDFIKKSQKVLSQIPVAYFLTCLTMYKSNDQTRSKARSYLDPVVKMFPQVKPVDIGLFAGVLDYSKMSYMKAMIFKSKMKKKGVPEGDHRNWDAIRFWAKGLSSKLQILRKG